METDRQDAPDTVRLAKGGAAVTLEWPQRSVRLTASRLRGACRCAWCTRALRQGTPIGDADAITLFEPMGGDAVHIAFSDGHRTGVYPWRYLDELASAREPTP